MKTTKEIIETAIRTIQEESASIARLSAHINEDFAKCVEAIIQCKGRVVITGIGKSAHIASKIVATFNSTGTPAIFMHAADAIHGDLGIIQKEDIVIFISKSGNTPEIKVLIPLIKMLKNPIVALVGNTTSYLAKNADFLLQTTVEKEACPNNLAPTTSTTAQLVIGDALALCLLEYRGFTTSDFAKLHPGGMLGKNLYLKAEDLMKFNPVPIVSLDANINQIIIEITSKRLGATAVVNENGNLVGIITDGDLRRMLEKNHDMKSITAKDIFSPNPKTISKDSLVAKSLSIMKAHNITQLIVSENNKVLGFIHLHDILKEGFI